jgi:predicted MFS family arabinose efflux permease
MDLGFVVASFLGNLVMELIGLNAVFYLAGLFGILGVGFLQICSSRRFKRMAGREVDA